MYTCMISIHAPPRGATRKSSARSKRRLFQFTPLREGRRAVWKWNRDEGRNISIHAPPRGATCREFYMCELKRISIHAPPRGATGGGAVHVVPAAVFQFTPLREGRHEDEADQHRRGISIHAPPRGATGYPARTAQAMIFQFTPLREGRLMLGYLGGLASIFQFTPLREGRPLLGSHKRRKQNISIHAPPRGATV